MRLWQLKNAKNHEIVEAVPDYLERWAVDDWAKLNTTKPVDLTMWKPPRLYVKGGMIDPDATETEGPQPAKHSDVLVDGGTEVFLRDAAIEAVAPLLEPYGQLLPVDSADGRLVLWHCTAVVDCFDLDTASVRRSPTSPDRILMIERAAFRPEAVPSTGLFVLPENYDPDVWATDDFVEKFRSTGMQGVEFILQWESERDA